MKPNPMLSYLANDAPFTDGCRRVRLLNCGEMWGTFDAESLWSRLTLGGGYGWLSGEHGLAIDNLVQVRRNISSTSASCARY